LIAASQAALDPAEPRDYRADPKNANEGEVLFMGTKGLVEDHAKTIVGQAIPELYARGFNNDEIAILYKRKGPFLDVLEKELLSAGIPFVREKHEHYPRTKITRWLQQVLQLSLAYADIDDVEVDYSVLVDIYHSMLSNLGPLRLGSFQLTKQVVLIHQRHGIDCVGSRGGRPDVVLIGGDALVKQL
jgi:hypothetical protein